MIPKISVLTPSYNTGQYLERAIQSVLNQSYPDFEHIIFDGGSTDNTLEILKKYPHLKWTSEPDKGQSDAMNKAFDACSGHIVVYLNADDYFAPEAFDNVAKVFTENPEADMVVGNLEIVHLLLNQRTIDSPSVILKDILNIAKGTIYPKNPVSYFYKKELQEKIGPFTVNNHQTMDVWFLYRALLLGKAVKTEHVLGTFLNDGSNKTSDTYKMFRSLYRTTYDFVKEINIIPLDEWIDSQIDVFTTMKLEASQPYSELNRIYSSAWWKLGVSIAKVKSKLFNRTKIQDHE